MEGYKVKRIRLKDIQPNMILARDVVTDSGQVLFPRESPASMIEVDILLANDVDYIYIKDFPDSKLAQLETEQERQVEQVVITEQKKEFIAFENLYANAADSTKQYVSAICSGEDVFVKDLYSLPNKILKSLKAKSDVFSFTGNIKNKNKDLVSHSVNVSLLCNLFGYWLHLNDDDLLTLTVAGMLHDIGKTQISPELLEPKEKLTDRQKNALKRHPVYGYNLLKNSSFSESIRLVALMHHEEIDGSGFPSGLKGNEITDFAKIVTICDKYENAVSNRDMGSTFKKCPFDVIHDFEVSGYEKMDAKYLWIFLQNIAKSFVGRWAKLSNGDRAEIFFIHKNNFSRPIVKTEKGDIFDLQDRKDLFIESML